jgi:hypothetical protein
MGDTADGVAIWDALRPRRPATSAETFVREVVAADTRRTLASSVSELAVFDQRAEVVSGIAGLSGSFSERQRLCTEQLKRARQLGADDVPQARAIWIAVFAQIVGALAPEGEQVAWYGPHTHTSRRAPLF